MLLCLNADFSWGVLTNYTVICIEKNPNDIPYLISTAKIVCHAAVKFLHLHQC